MAITDGRQEFKHTVYYPCNNIFLTPETYSCYVGCAARGFI